MNQRRMDEMIVKAQVRMAERLVKWEQKWLGNRASPEYDEGVNYGDQLGSDVRAGYEPGSSEEEETEIYDEEERQSLADSEELGGIPLGDIAAE